MKKDLTLEEKYLTVASEVETSPLYIHSRVCEALMVLASKGEMHALADVFYLAEENENKNTEDRTNGLNFYPADFVGSLRKFPIAEKIKNEYFENPEFLTADKYMVMAGMVADEEERDKLYFRAAKNYLEDFRDYGNILSGAMFLKVLERSAKLNGTNLENSPVAENIKRVLLWGDAKQKDKLFGTLVASVKKQIVKKAKNKNDYASKFSFAFAIKNENSFGKTEMWYILEAKEGAGIYLGFKRDVTKEEVEQSIKDNTLAELLNFIKVKPGDCYFVKSGTVHAIGSGITLFEVQQNSSLTYRLYDWGKVGIDGKPRELHIEKSLKVMNLRRFEPVKFNYPLLGKCDYFSTYEYSVSKKPLVEANNDSFISITFIDGFGKVNYINFQKGDTFFIPAGQKVEISGNGKYLLTTIE